MLSHKNNSNVLAANLSIRFPRLHSPDFLPVTNQSTS